MSLTLFEWDRYVGTHMTPVDAVHNARAAGQTFEEYATEYAQSSPSDEILNDELVSGMTHDMLQAARNLASFRVTGSPIMGPHSVAIFEHAPDDPDEAAEYYSWVETADEHEIVARVTAEQPA